MASALVILADGFEEIEAVTIVDVLRRGGVSVTTASVTGAHVRGSHDIVVTSDVLLEAVNVDDFDALVLPGGPAAKTLREEPHVLQAIQRAAAGGKWLAAVCAGPTVLEAAGVLKGKRATVYPGHALPSAQLVGEPVVEDGKIVTSRGPGTTMAFALTLLERLTGAETARQTGERLLFGG